MYALQKEKNERKNTPAIVSYQSLAHAKIGKGEMPSRCKLDFGNRCLAAWSRCKSLIYRDYIYCGSLSCRTPAQPERMALLKGLRKGKSQLLPKGLWKDKASAKISWGSLLLTATLTAAAISIIPWVEAKRCHGGQASHPTHAPTVPVSALPLLGDHFLFSSWPKASCFPGSGKRCNQHETAKSELNPN